MDCNHVYNDDSVADMLLISKDRLESTKRVLKDAPDGPRHATCARTSLVSGMEQALWPKLRYHIETADSQVYPGNAIMRPREQPGSPKSTILHVEI